jgi:uncharacterized membrane protein YoaK (UPF0700 family)
LSKLSERRSLWSVVTYGPNEVTSLRHLPSWALLAFGAGAVNAGAFVACQRFVSHVTGTLTHVGVGAGKLIALEYLLVVACFIMGATSAVLLVRRLARSGHHPWWLPLTIVAGLLCLVAMLGQRGLFGELGSAVETPEDFGLLALLSIAMGMQSAAVAASTGLAVRTTHMTGPATDLSIALATLLAGERAETESAWRSAALRGTKLVAFVLGAVAMVPLASRVGFLSFIVPAAACVSATVLSFTPRRAPQPNT